MKRDLSIYILCLIITVVSYNICDAQESGYDQSDRDTSAASTDNFDGEIPEINKPVELWMFIENYRFVTGQMVQLTLQMMWQLGVSVDIDAFKNADLSPFVIEKASIGERQIFNNDCDYRIITYLLSLPDEAENGIYTIPPFLVSYRDEANKTDGKARTAPFSLKKVPVMLEAKVDRDVVNIGDIIHYDLTVWHEKDIKILKENMDKLDFSPFQVLDYKVEEETEHRLKKTIIKYKLSIYDLPEKKGAFEIPSLPVLYYSGHEGVGKQGGEELVATQELNTPAIPILINSLLKRIDVPLESIKGPVVHERKDICLKGHLPIILGVVIILVLGVFEARKYVSRLTAIVKEKISTAPLAHAEHLEELVANLDFEVETDELKKSVINVDCGLRSFLGSLAEKSREEALSFTTTSLIDILRHNKVAEQVVESANNTLKIFDNMIFGDIGREEVKKVVGEVREILKETKRRGYY